MARETSARRTRTVPRAREPSAARAREAPDEEWPQRDRDLLREGRTRGSASFPRALRGVHDRRESRRRGESRRSPRADDARVDPARKAQGARHRRGAHPPVRGHRRRRGPDRRSGRSTEDLKERAMLKLYMHPYSTYSRRVRIAMLEKNLPFESVVVDMAARKHREPEYLA